MAFVQKADSGTLQTATSVSTAAFPANVTAGNFLCALITWGSTSTTPTGVTINGKTATALLGTPVKDIGNSQSANLYYAENATGGSTTGATVTFAASTNFIGVIAHEHSGILTSASLDGTGGSAFVVSGTTGTTSSWTTTQANDEIVFGFVDSSGTTTAINTPTATSSTLTIRDTTGTVEMSTASGTQTASGSTTGTWTWTGSSAALLIAAAFKTSGAVVDQPPSEVWFETWGDAIEAPDHGDASIFDFYADNTVVGRADVQPPIAPYLPDSYEWEDPDRWDDAVWLWPLSQAPPIPDFVPDYIRPQDGSDQPEDFDEDFGFSSGPLPADVVVTVATPDPQLPDPPEEPDEDFGFVDWQAPDQSEVFDQLITTFSGYTGEPDELEWFTFSDAPAPDAPQDLIYPDLWDDWQEEPDEDFGYAQTLPDDVVSDQAYAEDAGEQIEDADEDFGFADQPLADDNDVGIRAEFPDQSEEPEDEPFAFSADPLPDDVQSDQVFTEDATEQPPDPEDEDFGQAFDPVQPDLVIESDQVFVEDARNQEGELPPDEDFGFSCDPTPDDVIPVPFTVIDTHDGAKKRRKREEERKRREEQRREAIENLVSPKTADIEIPVTQPAEKPTETFKSEESAVIIGVDEETPDDDEDDIEAILLLMRP